MISAEIKSNLNRGGLSVSAAKEKRIQALAFWLNYAPCTGSVKVEADFDETEFTIIKMNEVAMIPISNTCTEIPTVM